MPFGSVLFEAMRTMIDCGTTPPSAAGGQKVFGLSESQITRRVSSIAMVAGLADWDLFSGHSGRVGLAHRMA